LVNVAAPIMGMQKRQGRIEYKGESIKGKGESIKVKV
jgi:hypothetical protein